MKETSISIERQVELIKRMYEAENTPFEDVPHVLGPLDGMEAPVPLVDNQLPEGQQYKFSMGDHHSRNHVYKLFEEGLSVRYVFIGTVE